MSDSRFVTTTKTKPKDSSEYTVLILASVPGERMRTAPGIGLFPVDNTYLLDLQYKAIREVFPKGDVILISGASIGQIIERCPKGLRILENQNFLGSGETEELRLGLNACVTESVILLCGNVCTDTTALAQIKTRHSSILIDSNNFCEKEIGVTHNNSKAEHLSFGIPDKWCGLLHITGHELTQIRKFANIRTKSDAFLFDAINFSLSHDGLIYTVNNKGSVRRVTK